MTWLYVPPPFSQSAPEQEDLTSASDWLPQLLERSLMWKGKPSLSRTWLRRLKTDSWMQLLFGTISEPSTADRGVALWIASLAESHVRTSPLPASGPERPENRTSGRTPDESLKRSGPMFSFLRTSLESLHLPELDCAYAAGLIDGEGWIGITSRKGKHYGVQVMIGMAEKGKTALEWMQSHFGGTVALHRKRTAKWETTWRWHINGASAATLLLAILPYLRVKTPQAELALKMQGLLAIPPRRTKWTEGLVAQCSKMKEKMHSLNQTGPSAPTVEDAWQAMRQEHHITSTPLGQSFDQWATELRKDYSQRLESLRHTIVSGSSSWHTPTVDSGSSRKDSTWNGRYYTRDKDGRKVSSFLTYQVSHWPTAVASTGAYAYGRGNPETPSLKLDGAARKWPTAMADHGSQTNSNTVDETNRSPEVASSMWPTATAADGDKESISYGRSMKLSGQARLFPTPAARDYKDWDGPNKRSVSKDYEAYSHLVQMMSNHGHECSRKCRRLNPLFVSWLMGWPIMWTLLPLGRVDYESSVMEWSHWWEQSRSALLQIAP